MRSFRLRFVAAVYVVAPLATAIAVWVTDGRRWL
jgi:hypothetical protein